MPTVFYILKKYIVDAAAIQRGEERETGIYSLT